MSWPDVEFESIHASPSRNGVYKPKEFHGRGSRIVNMGELFGYNFISNQDMKRVELNERELEANSLEDGDLLFGRRSLVEAGAGKCSLVVAPSDSLTFESSIIRVRINKEAANPRFLYYYFLSPQGRRRIRSIVSGTTVKGIRGSDLKQLLVANPPKGIQDEIVDILSAYDDLIENNRRRMVLLEDSARLLYNEWFVRLRFPGYEHTRIIDGVPEGWKIGTINDLVEIQSGFAFKTGTYDSNGQFGIVTIKNVQDGEFVESCDNFVFEPPRQLSSQCHLKSTDILLSLTGNIGRCCLVVGENYLLNQRVAKLIPLRPKSSAFCYFIFRDEEIRGKLIAISHGVAQQNLSPVKMGGLPFCFPTSSLLETFNDFAEPIVSQLVSLKQQNQKLRAARDLLLPRLMSGEIAV